MTTPRTAPALLALAALLVALVAPGSALTAAPSQPRLLSGPAVQSAQISPDGAWAVFIAETDGDPVGKLYSVRLDGGEPVLLNSSPQAFDDYVASYQISADSAHVVFQADAAPEPAVRQLYSVPIGGGAARLLSAGLPAGHGVLSYEVLPGGPNVFFSSGPPSSDRAGAQIFLVSAAAGAPRRINPPLSGQQLVEFAKLSADGSRVVFGVAPASGSPQPTVLYAAALPNGPAVEVARPFSSADSVQLQFSPDARWLIYARPDDSLKIFRLSTSGGTAQQLAVPAEATQIFSSEIGPDGARLVYAANTNGGFSDLYSVPLAAAGPAAKLTDFMPEGSEAGPYRISADGARVVFQVREVSGSGRSRLYSVPAGGGAATEIPAASQLGGGPGPFWLSPDGARIVYYEQTALRSVPIAGGPAVVIADNISPSGGVAYSFNYAFSPDGSHLIFRNALLSDSSRAPLLVAPLDRAGAARQLSGEVAYVAGQPNLSFDNFGAGFDLSASGARVIFRGAAGATLGRSLYAVTVDELLGERVALPQLSN